MKRVVSLKRKLNTSSRVRLLTQSEKVSLKQEQVQLDMKIKVALSKRSGRKFIPRQQKAAVVAQ